MDGLFVRYFIYLFPNILVYILWNGLLDPRFWIQYAAGWVLGILPTYLPTFADVQPA